MIHLVSPRDTPGSVDPELLNQPVLFIFALYFSTIWSPVMILYGANLSEMYPIYGKTDLSLLFAMAVFPGRLRGFRFLMEAIRAR